MILITNEQLLKHKCNCQK